MWGIALVSFISISAGLLLGLSSEKTMMRNWMACVALITGVWLGYMTGQS